MDILEIMKDPKGYNSNNLNIPESLRRKPKELCWRYNQTSPNETEKRKEILKELLGTCHEFTFIEPSFQCDYGFNIHMHGPIFMNHNCVILDTSPVNIGANAFIGPGTCIACAGHSISAEQRSKGISTSKAITIGNDVWIGANVTVCAGVTIGSGSVIGAGSVVNKDIPDGVVAAGAPCKVIRKITEEDKINPSEISI